MSEIRCPSCDIVLSPGIIADGWCGECGKKIPEYLHTKRTNPAAPVNLVAHPDAKPQDEREQQAKAETEDPEADELPRITEPYEPGSYLTWAGALVLGSVVLFLFCYPFGLVVQIAGGVLCGVLLVLALCFVFLEVKIMPAIRRDLRALQNDEYLVKWEYTASEWLRFIRAEWKSKRWWALVVILGLMAVVGAVLLWSQNLPQGATIAVILVICFGSFAFTAGCIHFGLAVSKYWRGWQAVRATYIGSGLACFNRRYYIWNRLGFWLSSVRVILGEQTVLELDLRWASRIGPLVRILVPHGKLDEAHEIVRKLGGGKEQAKR
jgi:hypothetical protein